MSQIKNLKSLLAQAKREAASKKPIKAQWGTIFGRISRAVFRTHTFTKKEFQPTESSSMKEDIQGFIKGLESSINRLEQETKKK